MTGSERQVLAIDPGYTESAYAWIDSVGRVLAADKVPNDEMLSLTASIASERPGVELVVEMVQSFGKPVGAEVFETCVWIGRFTEAACGRMARLTRSKVKSHLCHAVAKVTDAVIRQALIDRYGPTKQAAIGTKKQPGPLYGVVDDQWSALAVAVTWLETTGGGFMLPLASEPVILPARSRSPA